MKIRTYLQRAGELGIIPNFWLSEEYLLAQPEARVEANGDFIWIQEEGWALFPPLPLRAGVDPYACPPMKIWSDFANYAIGEPIDFLDWEYIYRAHDFNDMKGRRWSSFRRNSRKWPRRNSNWVYIINSPAPSEDEIRDLLIRWLGGKAEEEIHDYETMLHFLFFGNNRSFILKEDRLVGMNVWDVCADYLIFRYCVTDPGEQFLQEFARLQFYQTFPGHLVIDGGTLGNKGLERFKDKMNPAEKRKVRSREVKG